LVKKREVKIHDDVVNLAQACTGELLRVLKGAVVNLAQNADAGSGELLRVLG
jgi:hypothetical protein